MNTFKLVLFMIAFTFGALSANAGESGIENLIVESIEVEKTDDGNQIDLDQGGKIEEGVVILDAAGRRNVSMACFTTEGGHRLKITVNNRNRSSRQCSSHCYYRTSKGRTGTQRCSARVRGNYNGEFCSVHSNNLTYTVTDPGAFDCSR